MGGAVTAPPDFLLLEGKMLQYRTIMKEGRAEFTERRSRFIGYVKPVAEEQDAVDFINQIKNRHWDATHNVYAYILRENNIQRYSDDGEPQGTAGIPVLDVIRKEEITDCVVVVTRYFGGILLGGGGLVRAYSHGSKIALDAGGIVTMSLCIIGHVVCDYQFYGRLSSMIPEMGGKITDTVFESDVNVSFLLKKEVSDNFDKKLMDYSNGRYHLQILGEKYDSID